MSILKKLEFFDNPSFCFNEKYHSYSFEGNKLQSVTKFISQFHLPFDSESVSKKVAEKTGREQSLILEEWKEKNEKSIKIGHGLHNWVENFFNKQYQDLPTDLEIVKRINNFNLAWVKFLHKLTPVAFEKRIFHKDWGLAGTMDALFSYGDKTIILDYKSNGEFRDDEHPKGTYNKLLTPFEDLWQNHFNDYSIQVSLYSLILEEVADIKVDKCFLLHLNSEGYKMYTALDLRDRLRAFLNSGKDFYM